MLSQFFLNENAKEKYIENKEKRNTITREIDSEITKGRSLWFAYTQKNNKESIENTRYKAKIFLYSLCFIFLVFFIFGFIWLRQLRAKEKQYQLFQQKINSLTEKKQVQNIISEKTENLLLTKLNKFELTTDFLNPNISLQSLAKKLDTNTKYLSETINTHKQKNFNAYINELRINYILLKLKDETIYRNYKIGYLAEECGFSSHSLFTSVFKSVTGMSPMTYIKFLSEKEE